MIEVLLLVLHVVNQDVQVLVVQPNGQDQHEEAHLHVLQEEVHLHDFIKMMIVDVIELLHVDLLNQTMHQATTILPIDLNDLINPKNLHLPLQLVQNGFHHQIRVDDHLPLLLLQQEI